MLDDASASGFGGDREPWYDQEDVKEVLFFLRLAEHHDPEDKTPARTAFDAFCRILGLDSEQARSTLNLDDE
jgi:hypothetical protein